MTTLNDVSDNDHWPRRLHKYLSTLQRVGLTLQVCPGSSGGNPCGNLDGYLEGRFCSNYYWTMALGLLEMLSTASVEHVDGVNNLNEYGTLYPGRVVVGNNGSVELKTYDGGNSRLTAFNNTLSFYDPANPNGVSPSQLVMGTGNYTSGFMPAMVNFPGVGVHTHEQGTAAQSVHPADQEAVLFDPRWVSADCTMYLMLRTILKQLRCQPVVMLLSLLLPCYNYLYFIGNWLHQWLR